MKRPQDSDIFGTKTIGYAPRINNTEKIDPNAQFQAKIDAQYDQYARKVGSSHRGIFTNEKTEQTKVMEQAGFDENYHKFRKQADMQSTIFYQPSLPSSRVTQRSKITQRFVPKHAYNQEDIEYNFGKKQTLSRQVKALPQNITQFKGNSSNIFGYDEHVDRNGVKNKVSKLIPHQMQWNDHDSVRYQDNFQSHKDQSQKSQNLSVTQSKSQLFDKDEITKKITSMRIQEEKFKQNDFSSANMLKKKEVKPNPEQKQKKQKSQKPKQTADQSKVQIMILKGWSSNIMEDLSKYCRLNSTKILTVNFEEGGKGKLVLDKSKRWQTITDWLRKDAKLKIRVLN